LKAFLQAASESNKLAQSAPEHLPQPSLVAAGSASHFVPFHLKRGFARHRICGIA
jgi:hypothetical protein